MSLYVALLFAVAVVMMMLKLCSRSKITTDDVRAGGDTLNIAIELSPTGMFWDGDTLAGFHYDVVKKVERLSGRNVVITGFTRLETALKSLSDHRYDIVVSDIPATVKIKNEYMVTSPVAIDRQVLVRHKSSGPVTQVELAGDTVYVPEGSPYIDRIRSLGREIGDTIHVVEDPDYSSEQLVIMTAIGEIKQAVVSERLARRMALDYDSLDISTAISFNQFQSWIVTPGDTALLDSVNVWLSNILIDERH